MNNFFEDILLLLPKITNHHIFGSSIYHSLDLEIKNYIKKIKTINGYKKIEFFNKNIKWPVRKFGNVSSNDSFSLNQMIYYSFYYKHRNNYQIVADFGSHTGEDAIFMSMCGYRVYAYEPDKVSFKLLKKNVALNKCKKITLINKAISNNQENLKFINVKGNTLANHVSNSREFYGDYSIQNVQAEDFNKLKFKPDLMKINIEGFEKKLIPIIKKTFWRNTDSFVELHGKDCAEVLLKYCKKLNLNIYSQKIAWNKAKKIKDLPLNWSEGCIFLTKKNKMRW